MNIKNVGVIGAGVMGIGVAQSLADTGHDVILIDVDETILESARKQSYNNIRMTRLLGQSKGKESPNDVLAKITFTTDYESLADVDFVVENVVEKIEAKKPVYAELDRICPAHCVIAANTSCISITQIGSWTNRPDRIIGMHFMNPVPLKSVVEVIRGYYTSEETIEISQLFLSGMNKRGIIVNDMPGFVSNRVLMLTVNEAVYVIQDQVAVAEEVDEIFRECFGHQLGPLQTADLIGLDTILYSLEVLYNSYNDSKYRPCPLLKKMVAAGLHGRKTGQGFYTYQ